MSQVSLDCDPISLLLDWDLVVLHIDVSQASKASIRKNSKQLIVESGKSSFCDELERALQPWCKATTAAVCVFNHRDAHPPDERWSAIRPARCAVVNEAIPALPSSIVRLIVDFTQEQPIAPCAVLW